MVVFRRRWLWIVGTALLFSSAGLVGGLRSRSAWWVQASFTPVTEQAMAQASTRAGMAVRPRADETPQYFATLLQSRGVLGAVAAGEYSIPSSTGAGAVWLPTHYGIDAPDSSLAIRAAVGVLSRSLQVLPNASSGMVAVRFEAPAPDLARAVAGALLHVTDSVAGAIWRREARAEQDFLRARANEARRAVVAAESALVRFDESNRQFARLGPLGLRRRALEAEVTWQAREYLRLEAGYADARLRASRVLPTVQVVDPPTEPRRTGSPVAAVLLVTTVAGLFAGIIAALTVEYMLWQAEQQPWEARRLVETVRRFLPLRSRSP